MSVWRQYIIKPKMNNYISPVIEVGYSHYGPTFSIAGTIKALNTIVLVNNICVEITNMDDKTYHFMDWFAFRPAQYMMGNFSEIDLTMTSKFTITPEKAYDYNILFIDNGRFSEMKPVLKAIKDAWEEALIIAAKEERKVNPGALFSEFKDLKIMADAQERLKTSDYWGPGHYQVKIRVTTNNPKQVFDTEKYFLLEQKDVDILTNNTLSIISNICQQTQTSYACATPKLTDKK